MLRRFGVAVLCLALAAIALGRALQVSDGFYTVAALSWLIAALVLTLAGTLLGRTIDAPARAARTALTIALAAGVAWQVWELLAGRPPGRYVAGDASLTTFRLLVAGQALGLASCLVPRWALRRAAFPAVLALSAAIGVWMIRASPDPGIDVVQVHEEAIEALLADRDPYRIRFRNLYDEKDSAAFYNPNAVIGDRLGFAYPYPPASLLLAVPGHVLAGDYRYSQLAWLIVAAALIGYSTRSRAAPLSAGLLLTTPRVWFVVEQGWTEPIAILTLALTVFWIARGPVAAGWAAGLYAVTKQYLAFSGFAVVRLLWLEPRRWRWIAAGMVASAAIVTLPLALWHPSSFARSVLFLQANEPFRIDSLSFLTWAAHAGWGQGTYRWAVGAGTIASIVSVLTTRNTAAGFAASVATTTFVMFAFGSKAFCNYYFFVIGALCAAVAAASSAAEDDV